jgi:hypothetical protein
MASPQSRVAQVEQMDRRFERMDHTIDRHFIWTVALLASMLVAVVRSFYQ